MQSCAQPGFRATSSSCLAVPATRSLNYYLLPCFRHEDVKPVSGEPVRLLALTFFCLCCLCVGAKECANALALVAVSFGCKGTNAKRKILFLIMLFCRERFYFSKTTSSVLAPNWVSAFETAFTNGGGPQT